MKLSSQSVENLYTVLRRNGKQPMPMKLSWLVKEMLDAFEPVAIRIGQTLAEIRDAYADRDSDGIVIPAKNPATGESVPGTFVVTHPDKVSIAKKEIEDMYAIETNFPNLKKIPLSLFPDTFQISPEDNRILQAVIDPNE